MEHRRLRGPDLHSPSQELVVNETGSTIAKLKVVRGDLLGTIRPVPTIQLANPTDRVIGVCNSDIPDTKMGYVTAWGFITKIDTTAWLAGTLLYCGPGGTLTTIPADVPIAKVLKSDAINGVLFVRTLGYNTSDFVASTSNTIMAIQFADWVSDDAGDTWSITLTHNLGTFYPEIMAYIDLAPDEEVQLHRIRVIDQNNTKISVCQAGVDGRFDGFLVLDK